MKQSQASRTVKKSASLRVNEQLLAEAKVKVRRSAKWLEENKAELEALNNFVDEHGVFNHKGRVC